MKFSQRWSIISKGLINKDFPENYTEKSQVSIISENLNHEDLPNKEDNVISELVSELFNHIESKESFDFISDLLVTSLSIYKTKFSVENDLLNPEKALNIDHNVEINNFNQKISDTKTEYLSISNDIHSILSSCPDLSSNQKLDYCSSQRYFMKLYLKEVVIKINEK